MHRVAITGLGWVTALGRNVRTVWSRLLAGDSGIRVITYFDASEYPCKVAAEVGALPDTGPELESVPRGHWRRTVRLFAMSAQEAHADAGLAHAGLDPQRIGIVAGTSVNYVNIGLLRHYYRFRRNDAPALDLARFARDGCQPESAFSRRLGDFTAAVPAKLLGCRGPNITIDTACAASGHAIGEAFRHVRRGTALAMIAGGASAVITPVGILAFSVLRALSRNPDPAAASRPFDRWRDGFVMGEAGGAVVLENLEHARARGARIYAEIAGFGSTTNAHTLTDPSPDGACEAHAMRLALDEAELPIDVIDYIAAHGTSTRKNDAVESLAIKRVFGAGAARLLVSSNKGQLGHTIAAAGVSNLIAAAKAMTESVAPPTVNHDEPDPECDLDYVPNRSRPAEIRAALVNAFAFGGQNAVVALRHVEV
ncbi:MAG: beta-ketoacyl-[acyl-carrier-protein] synthase family protein [Vicinamibacteraceae bacterium]